MRERSIDTAKISFDGPVGGRDGLPPVKVFRLEVGDVVLRFVAAAAFAENRNDFTITISKFGIGSKYDAESTGGILNIHREEFDREIADAIRRRLERFFMGDERKPFGPYVFESGKCLGVRFPDGWIKLA